MDHYAVQNSTDGFFIFADDSTAIGTGKTGLTITTTLAKASATPSSVSPTITEVGNGFYWVVPSSTHRNTLGRCLWQFSATGAIIAGRVERVGTFTPEYNPATDLGTVITDTISLKASMVTALADLVTIKGYTDQVEGYVDTLESALATLSLAVGDKASQSSVDTISGLLQAAMGLTFNGTTDSLVEIRNLLDLIKVIADKYDTMVQSDGGSGQEFTTPALANAPSGGGGGGDVVVTLAVPQVLENAGYDPTSIVQYRGTDWIFDIEDLGNLSSYDSMFFTLKKRGDDQDSLDLLRIDLNGLQRHMGTNYTNSALGSLEVIDAVTGIVRIQLSYSLSKLFKPSDNLKYDLKGVNSSDKVKMLHRSNNFVIADDVTRDITI